MLKSSAQMRTNARDIQKGYALMDKEHGARIGMVFDIGLIGGAFKNVRKILEAVTPVIFGDFDMLKIAAVNTFTRIREAFKPAEVAAEELKTKMLEQKESANILSKSLSVSRTEMDKASVDYMAFLRQLSPADITPLEAALGAGGGPPSMELDLAGLHVPFPMAPLTQFEGPAGQPGIGSFMGLAPPPEAEEATKGLLGKAADWTKMKKGSQFFKKQVMTPLSQIAGAGIGLGFQVTFIMGLMQAFAGLFSIFQPVIDVVGLFVEMIGTGFMPIVSAAMMALTSPEMLGLVAIFTAFLLKLSTAFAPLIPIVIDLIMIGLLPVAIALTALTPLLEMATPYIKWFGDTVHALLEPVTQLMTAMSLLSFDEIIGFFINLGGSIIYYIGTAILGGVDFLVNSIINAMNLIPGINFEHINLAGVLAGVPHFQMGGIMPHTGYAYLHKDEEVLTPEERGSRGAITINIDGGIYTTGIDDLVSTIGRKLNLYRY